MVKKRKLIFNVAMLIVAIAVIVIIGVRYFIAPDTLPAMFVTLEMVAWLLAAFIVLWLFRLNAVSEAKFQNAHQWAITQKTFFEARQIELEKKIKQLEGLDEHQLSYQKKEILQKFQSKIKTKSLHQFQQTLLPAFANAFELTSGILYWFSPDSNNFKNVCNYALGKDFVANPFVNGEGFCGQAAAENKIISLTNIPEGYIETESGLGMNQPNHLYFLPINVDGGCIGLVEIASFKTLELDLTWPEINQNIENVIKSFNGGL
jgi:hypothetical protein